MEGTLLEASPALAHLRRSLKSAILLSWRYHFLHRDVPAGLVPSYPLVDSVSDCSYMVDGRIFPLWPLRPAGYAVASSTWTFGWLWFSVFISWTTKVIILKFGGIGLYRKALPLFLGLLLGEYIVGGACIRLLLGVQVYSFYR
jgi:hypothetical protein